MARILFTILLTFLYMVSAQATDEIIFGQPRSEQNHQLRETSTEIFHGAFGETARRMLPTETENWQGGRMTFVMKVDSENQNYFTVRLFGSEADDAIVMLFIDGKQIGYRHLGDYDLLHRGNGEAPCFGKFYYVTVPLPKSMTQGRKRVQLELRSYGNTWDYGETFKRYQKSMKDATIGFYRAYTHTERFFQPSKKERQGTDPLTTAQVRTHPDKGIIEIIKHHVNQRIHSLLKRKDNLGQQDAWLLADAYSVEWTPAYKNPVVLEKVVNTIDSFCDKQTQQPDIIYKDRSVYNSDWMTTALLARSIRALWNDIRDSLQSIERTQRWTKLLKVSIEYGVTHRRQYTNQSMIIDMAIYENNRALMLISPSDAQPEYLTLQYLYESLGMAPWSGSQLKDGTQSWPLGYNYWQLTARGLTKELGYVGYYGEVADWVCHIYEATCLPNQPHSGDAKIREQLLRIVKARYPFRYPAVDAEGFRCFRAEALVGWRDGNHYPGDVMYGDRGTAWDANPIMTAALTADPEAIAIARQSIDDGQIWNILSIKMKEINNPRVVQSLLRLPENYDFVSKYVIKTNRDDVQSTYQLPMSHTAPDFVFSDEEDGVVAIKRGDERLYVSLYWRARMGVNRLCKIHYMTPNMERVANVFVNEVQFTTSGMTYTRPDRINMEFVSYREFYKDINSAHAGEQLPIAQIPEGIKFKPGQENAYAGKADFYRLDYGPYIICMNCSSTKDATTTLPEGYLVFSDGRWEETNAGELTLTPRTTYVLYKSK